MKVLNSRRRLIALAALVLLLLFVLRPGASRLKSRIVTSISSAVGRQVEVGSVRFRLLPRPGFELHELVVYDDPAFGAEPMLRAGEVSAALRVTSLLRGRLEIARLDLTEPSLNLVHAPQGGWNLEALVERSAHNTLAPTGKAKSEPRPAFPYIEGTAARINFKYGPEKKPYAFTNADFALWQDSENIWGIRLKAEPFRSDFNLNDMGLLQVNGTWQRAALVRDMPLKFSIEWSRAQLGQITKFLSGVDWGWRGAVQLDVTLTGTPANLDVSSSASVQDFRRYDIVSGDALKLGAHCDGHYSSLDHTLRGIQCTAPVGDGLISIQGDMGFAGSRKLDLLMTADNVPAKAAIALARRAKKNLPEDLTASGLIRGRLSWRDDAVNPAGFRFEGHGEISDLTLASPSTKTATDADTVPFLFRADASEAPRRKLRSDAPAGPRVEFGPFRVALGRAVTARGWIARSGYNVALSGDADINKTLRLARLSGLPTLPTGVDGSATIDLRVAGSWDGWSYGSSSGFASPHVLGIAKLRNVRTALRAAPLEIVSGELELLPDSVRLEKLSARAAGANWTGSVELPRGCGTLDQCPLQFRLNVNEISSREVANWLNPNPAERPWYRVLQSSPPVQPSWLASLHASGQITADRVEVGRMPGNHVAANLRFEHGKVQISQLSASLLGGMLTGEWLAELSPKTPTCSGHGKLTGISLASLADALRQQEQVSGAANAIYEVKGMCGSDFWAGADGSMRLRASNAVLAGISLSDDASPLKIAQFSGDARLHNGWWAIDDAKLDSDSGKFEVSGTASLGGALDLKLARPANMPGGGFSIAGTLTEPEVKPTPAIEQARLKTEPAK